MNKIYLTIFGLQFFSLVIDEFYFHYKRGLPKWERIGHPLDTITIILCFGFLNFYSVSETNIKIYAVLAVFSSIFVTKDEAVHLKECCAKEQWLHALLFLLHPTALFASYLLWVNGDTFWIHNLFIGSCVFLIYQIIFWNFIWKKKQ